MSVDERHKKLHRRLQEVLGHEEADVNFISTLFTRSEIQGLQVRPQSLLSLFRGRQICQRGFEIRFRRGAGGHFQLKPRDGIVDGHQHAIACARGFQCQSRRESERIQHPASSLALSRVDTCTWRKCR